MKTVVVAVVCYLSVAADVSLLVFKVATATELVDCAVMDAFLEPIKKKKKY